MVDIRRPQTKKKPLSVLNGDGAQEVELIWSFDARGNWKRVPNPIKEPWCGTEEEINAKARQAGFRRMDCDKLGAEFARFNMELFEADDTERFLIECWICDSGFTVLLPDFPSLFKFLSLASGMLAEGRAED
jgi:hypothetical protein